MSNQPTPATPTSEDELDKTLELLFERGCTDQYVETFTGSKTGRKKKAIAEAKSALQARERRIVLEARRDVWLELKKGEGLYTNENGCREVHVDYIDERIATLDAELKRMEKL